MDNKVFAPFKDLFSSSSIASSWTLAQAAMTFVPIAKEGGLGEKHTVQTFLLGLSSRKTCVLILSTYFEQVRRPAVSNQVATRSKFVIGSKKHLSPGTAHGTNFMPLFITIRWNALSPMYKTEPFTAAAWKRWGVLNIDIQQIKGTSNTCFAIGIYLQYLK